MAKKQQPTIKQLIELGAAGKIGHGTVVFRSPKELEALQEANPDIDILGVAEYVYNLEANPEF